MIEFRSFLSHINSLSPQAMASPNLFEVTSPAHFQELLAADLTRISLINFWAPWVEPCKQMNEVVRELAKKYPEVLVLEVRIIICKIFVSPQVSYLI